MFRIIKWECIDMDITDFVFMNIISLSKGVWKGFHFGITGLGLNKFERDFFNTKIFFKRLNDIKHINIYFLKWVLSYNKDGVLEGLEKSICEIYFNKTLKEYIKISINNSKKILKYKFKNLFEDIKKKINIKKELILRKLDKRLQKEYTFRMYRSWEGEYSFKSDLLSAYQLASNYEADLMLNNRYLLSPLGFDWEENNKLIKKNLGKWFKYSSLGYKNMNSKEIKNYKRLKYKEV